VGVWLIAGSFTSPGSSGKAGKRPWSRPPITS
jgi:hypothetical protein